MLSRQPQNKSVDEAPARTLLSSLQRQEMEIDLLLQSVYQLYGYDFRHYAKASLHRRINNVIIREQLNNVAELIPLIVHDQYAFDRFLQEMSITVTAMFRDPGLFQLLKQKVLIKLQTYPRINIWHAGCATGEEVYSMAIMLHEAGLLERSRIYATDYNNQALTIAEKGIYPLKNMRQYSENYQRAGGEYSLSDYCHQKYSEVLFDAKLRDKITFAHHNLMKDQGFAQMHLVLCRNVLIYFDNHLKDRVLQMISNSLVTRGFLMLGDKETINLSSVAQQFESVSARSRIYQKKIQIVSDVSGVVPEADPALVGGSLN
ncbi:MAG: cheR-type MCP methyltransferase [Osedax symbiont Rs2]|nr:MAG: cheR-type MCP methyltransferase [Osedax symbiont Rs2]